MERESLLTLLIVLLGGVTLQLFAALPWRDDSEAALAHERAHVRHHDPLRIWIAQFVMDLQWPWRSAPRRFTAWLAALEEARDDEARAAGVDGADLAAALVGALRWKSSKRCVSDVGLIGQPEVVQARIARLLRPLPDAALSGEASRVGVTTALLVISSIMALVLVLVCGESVIRPLLRL